MRYSLLSAKTGSVMPATLGSLRTLADVRRWLLAAGVGARCVQPVEVDAAGDLLRLIPDAELRGVPADRRAEDADRRDGPEF